MQSLTSELDGRSAFCTDRKTRAFRRLKGSVIESLNQHSDSSIYLHDPWHFQHISMVLRDLQLHHLIPPRCDTSGRLCYHQSSKSHEHFLYPRGIIPAFERRFASVHSTHWLHKFWSPSPLLFLNIRSQHMGILLISCCNGLAYLRYYLWRSLDLVLMAIGLTVLTRSPMGRCTGCRKQA